MGLSLNDAPVYRISSRVKDERFPQFLPAFGRVPAGRSQKSAPPLPASGGRFAVPDPFVDKRWVTVVIEQKETTMSISLDQHIEELRAELRNAVYRDERRWIERELAKAVAERDAMLAEWFTEDEEAPF